MVAKDLTRRCVVVMALIGGVLALGSAPAHADNYGSWTSPNGLCSITGYNRTTVYPREAGTNNHSGSGCLIFCVRFETQTWYCKAGASYLSAYISGPGPYSSSRHRYIDVTYTYDRSITLAM